MYWQKRGINSDGTRCLSIEYDPLERRKRTPSRFHSWGPKVNACTHSTSRNVRTRHNGVRKRGRNQKRRRRRVRGGRSRAGGGGWKEERERGQESTAHSKTSVILCQSPGRILTRDDIFQVPRNQALPALPFLHWAPIMLKETFMREPSNVFPKLYTSKGRFGTVVFVDGAAFTSWTFVFHNTSRINCIRLSNLY